MCLINIETILEKRYNFIRIEITVGHQFVGQLYNDVNGFEVNARKVESQLKTKFYLKTGAVSEFRTVGRKYLRFNTNRG